MISVQPADASCGASVRGVDLSRPVDQRTLDELRRIWLEHQVIAFEDQQLAVEDLERFTLQVGPRGDDPYIAPIPGHKHVVEIRREADETSRLFAENWHSDWSFRSPRPRGRRCGHGRCPDPSWLLWSCWRRQRSAHSHWMSAPR